MPVYRVTLINNEEALNKDLEVEDDTYILDAAEEAGLDMPYDCRKGKCSACVGRILSGKVSQSRQKFLKKHHIEAGFVLTCVAYPRSHDLVIELNKAGDLI